MTPTTDHARVIFEAAVESVQADTLLRNVDIGRMASRRLDSYDHVWVIGLGKGSIAMASVLETHLGGQIDGGFAVTARGYLDALPERFSLPKTVEIGEGGHPVPDEGSRRAARRVLGIAERAGANDLVFVLITGGGSAVCTDFLSEISLADAQTTFRLLLESGVDIHAMNAVRKHMSVIGGGRLAAAIHPAESIALVISDVVGNDLSVIASGPMTGDPSTIDDAREVLRSAGIWHAIPERVRAYFDRAPEETPKPDSSVFEGVSHRLIGTNQTALRAAADKAEQLGYMSEVLREDISGEARDVGQELVGEALSAYEGGRRCFIGGGETSVTVRGSGKGGRNQEMALSVAIALHKADRYVVFLSGGTDGIDGPTDAAGAAVSSRTINRARQYDLDARSFLDRNDSYAFLDQVGGLIRTGPTHTNVMDIQIVLV